MKGKDRQPGKKRAALCEERDLMHRPHMVAVTSLVSAKSLWITRVILKKTKPKEKRFWLVKFAPFRTSWSEIVRRGTFTLRGVRSPAARNSLKEMQLRDSVLFSQSTGTYRCRPYGGRQKSLLRPYERWSSMVNLWFHANTQSCTTCVACQDKGWFPVGREWTCAPTPTCRNASDGAGIWYHHQRNVEHINGLKMHLSEHRQWNFRKYSVADAGPGKEKPGVDTIHNDFQ